MGGRCESGFTWAVVRRILGRTSAADAEHPSRSRGVVMIPGDGLPTRQRKGARFCSHAQNRSPKGGLVKS